MKIGINEAFQIKQIGEITDNNLIVIELDETSEAYIFRGWSDTRILCYCYEATENGVSIYPYIDINIIEKMEADSAKISQNRADTDYLAIMTGVDL